MSRPKGSKNKVKGVKIKGLRGRETLKEIKRSKNKMDKLIVTEEDGTEVTVDATTKFVKVEKVNDDGSRVELVEKTDEIPAPPEEVVVPLETPVVLKARV